MLIPFFLHISLPLPFLVSHFLLYVYFKGTRSFILFFFILQLSLFYYSLFLSFFSYLLFKFLPPFFFPIHLSLSLLPFCSLCIPPLFSTPMHALNSLLASLSPYHLVFILTICIYCFTINWIEQGSLISIKWPMVSSDSDWFLHLQNKVKINIYSESITFTIFFFKLKIFLHIEWIYSSDCCITEGIIFMKYIRGSQCHFSVQRTSVFPNPSLIVFIKNYLYKNNFALIW